MQATSTASRLFSTQRLSPLKASSDGDKPAGSGTSSTRPPEKPASDGPIKSSADQRKDQESPPAQSPEQKDKKPDSSKPKPDVVSPLLFQMASGRRRSPPTEMVFAGLGAYTGLVGSAAIALAWGAHIDLFSSFRWEAADIQTALQYIIPLQALNAAILLPNYSSWSLTDNTDSSMAGLKMQLAAVKARSSALSGSTAAQRPSGSTPTPVLPVVSPMNPLRTINDGMNLAQGHYISNNPTGNLSVGLEAVVAVLESLAGEMLYRGVFFVVFSRWVTDRLYEGGADDTILLPVRILGTEHTTLLTTVQGAQWAATALTALALVVTVTQKNLRAKRKYDAIVKEVKLGLTLDKNGRPLLGKPGGANSGSSSGSSSGGEAKEPKIVAVMARPGAYDAMGFGALVQGTLELTNLLTVNSVFIATGGNLAATFAASATNEIIFSLFQRFATQRLQKRSLEMATELQLFNGKLAAMVSKKKQRLQTGTALDEDAGGLLSASRSNLPPSQDATATPPPPPPSPAAGSEDATSTSSSSTTATPQQPHGDATPSQSAPAPSTPVSAASVRPTSPAATSTSLPDSGTTAPPVQSHPVSAPAKPATALSRTLSILDLMLPEEPKPREKKPQAAEEDKAAHRV
ncbi:MAG: hypothetical protein WDW36_001870 [Sanguina aurantia]